MTDLYRRFVRFRADLTYDVTINDELIILDFKKLLSEYKGYQSLEAEAKINSLKENPVRGNLRRNSCVAK